MPTFKVFRKVCVNNKWYWEEVDEVMTHSELEALEITANTYAHEHCGENVIYGASRQWREEAFKSINKAERIERIEFDRTVEVG
jgi:hypothetical protein